MATDPYAQFADAPADPYSQFADAPQGGPPLTAAAVPIAQAAPPQSVGSWLNSNLVSPLARSAVRAVGAVPLMAEDFGVAARNVGSDISSNGFGAAMDHLMNGGQYPYELPSTTVNRALNAVTQAPTSTTGKLSELADAMLMGGAASSAGIPGLTAPTFGKVPAAFVSPGVPGVGLTSAQQNAADAGQSLGMQLTPGQQTGSRALQQFEAKLQSQPWTSGPFNKLGANNQAVLNSAWAGPRGGIGEGGASLDSTVLAKAADRTGEVFNKARNANSIVLADPKTTSGVLDGIDQDFEGLIPGSIRSNPLVSRFETLTGQGAVNGEQLGNLSSKLGTAANNQMTSPAGDRQLGQALYAVKDHADDLLQSTLTGSDAAAYAAARQQYRALMQLTARTGNVNPSTGNVGGSSLANYLQAKDRPGFLYGRNQSDAYNTARFAQAFKPIVGDSGTATRSWGGLGGMALSIPGWFLSRGYLSTAGQAAVRGLMSTPGALKNGVTPQTLSGLMTGIANLQPSLWATPDQANPRTQTKQAKAPRPMDPSTTPTISPPLLQQMQRARSGF